MRTVGQILKEEREKRLTSLEEIEKSTKIRKELLEALEEGKYDKLPPPTFIQGFIKNYSRILRLDTNKLLAVFRREFSEGKHPPRILDSFKDPIEQKKFRITPARAVGGVIFAFVIIFFVYLWLEYRFLVGGPFLEVTYPPDQLSATSSTIEVAGRVDPESSLKINNQQIGVLSSGKFSQEINLADDLNVVVIEAYSKSGKKTKIERTVFLKR